MKSHYRTMAITLAINAVIMYFQKLCDSIVKSRQEEIAQMKAILERQ